MDEKLFEQWLRQYFEAWVSNDPEAVAALFAEDATYHVDPFEGPRMRGRAEIVQTWTADPETQTDIRCEYEPIVVWGERGLAHWRVSFVPQGAADRRVEMDGLLLLTFDPQGRCVEHREWYSKREVAATIS